MAELQVDVRPSGIESAVVYAPFDQALETLTKSGYDFISTAQNAQLRIEQGAKSPVSQNGNWVKEGIVYRPNENPRLVRVSPIISSANDATQAHRNGKEFYLVSSQIEQALADSIEFPVKNIEIPTKRFGEEALTAYVFGGEKQAQLYGAFLAEAGIKAMPVWAVDKNHINKQSEPFARQLWFGRLDGDRSNLGGNYDLDGGRVRGVRQVSTEGANASQISTGQGSELYDAGRIAKSLSKLGFSGLEEQLMKELRRK